MWCKSNLTPINSSALSNCFNFIFNPIKEVKKGDEVQKASSSFAGMVSGG
jgi:hypothetical protein